MKLTVVLPAFNEAENLPLLLDALEELHRTYRLRCIVVDDGSTDGTVQAITPNRWTMPVELIQHPENRGLPGALETGLNAACNPAHESEVVVCMDADNTHLPSQIPLMIAAMENGSDIVIASRYRPGAKVAGVSLFRRTLSIGAATLFSLFLPIRGVRDYSCGFRAYRASVLRIALREHGPEVFSLRGFACTTGLLLACRRMQAQMSEIPIDLRYHQKRGVSKIRLGRTISESLKLLWRERCTRARRLPRRAH